MIFEHLDPAELAPNSWNPNKQSDFMYEREKRSIRLFGFIDPITVRVVDGDREIVDGEHRWRAALELGLQMVTVFNLGEVSIERAMALTDILNNLRGNTDAKKQSEMVKSILADEPDLADLLPYTVDQLRQYMSPIDFESLSKEDDSAREPKHALRGRWEAADYEHVRKAMELAAKYLPAKSTPSDQVLFMCRHYLSQGHHNSDALAGL